MHRSSLLRVLSALVLGTLLVSAGCLSGEEGAPSPSPTPATATPAPTPASSPGTPATASTSPGAACAGAIPSEGKTSGYSAARPRAKLETTMGDVTVELFREEAPGTVGNWLKLASSGFYNGVKFHRVIAGFMIQTGDPLSKDDSKEGSWGTGGPGYKIQDELSARLRHDAAGILSMANSGPNTGGSQFFITLDATSWLDDKHAVFGRVASGMDVVKAIGNVKTEESDRPVVPVVIEKVVVLDPEGEPAASHSVSAHAVVPQKKTEPGRGARFMVVAANGGNVRDNLTFAVSAPSGWTCELEMPKVEVPAGTARVVLVTVTPPANAAAGASKASVTVASESDPARSAAVDLTVDVGSLGNAAASGSKVKGNYVGILEDGRLFDTSRKDVASRPEMGKSAFWGSDEQHSFQSFDFTVGSGVIQGFSELATGAKEGEVRAGRIPAAKAYGESGRAPLAGKTLLFELEILKVS